MDYRQLLKKQALLFVCGTVALQAFAVGLAQLSLPSFPSEKVVLQKPELKEARKLERQTARLKRKASKLSKASEPKELPELAEVSYTLRSGDTLSSVWRKHGASLESAVLAAKALEENKISLRSFHAGEKVELVLSDSGEVLEARKRSEDGTLVILEADEGNGYKAQKIEPKFEIRKRKVSGVISSSFSASASEKRIPYDVIDELVDLFSSRVEFRREIQVGDSFTVIYEGGDILAASLKTNGNLYAAVRHMGKDGKARYYDAQGEPLGSFFLRYPVKFSRISSQFSNSRFHPVLKRSRPHNGVDFAAPTGTPVRSVADGTVVVSGYRGGAGKMVKIKHSSKWQTAYLHLSKISPGVRTGSKVSRGQVIGAVGSTGMSTGPHLHFSLYEHGRYVDPMKVKLPKMDSSDPIPSSYLQATLRTLKRATRRAEADYASEKTVATDNRKSA